MAMAADCRLLLSPGNREPTNRSALCNSPESVLDFGSFEDLKTATITSPTTCSFDILALKSFDELAALVGTLGYSKVHDMLVSLKDDDDDWDSEIVTQSSFVEFSGIVVLEIVTMAMLF